MANENGHIYAPVSTDDVASVLGMASHDVATLCMSDNINQASLIVPMSVLSPHIGPESFEDIVTDGDDIPSSTGTSGWQKAKWGFYVPYVTNPANIRTICALQWRRKALSANSFKCLVHFDGYRHNATPLLPLNADVDVDKEIVVSIKAPGVSTNVLSETGIGNNGGTVSVANVLGTGLRYGCSIYRNKDGGVATLLGHYINPNPSSSNTEFTEIPVIYTGITGESGWTYLIFPWVTDGNIVNGNIQSNSKFYGLKMSSDIDTIIVKEIKDYRVYFTNIVREGNTLTVTVKNTFPSTTAAKILSDFKVHFLDTTSHESESKTVTLSPFAPLSVAPESTATRTFTVPTGNDYNFSKAQNIRVSAKYDGETIYSMYLLDAGVSTS